MGCCMIVRTVTVSREQVHRVLRGRGGAASSPNQQLPTTHAWWHHSCARSDCRSLHRAHGKLPGRCNRCGWASWDGQRRSGELRSRSKELPEC